MKNKQIHYDIAREILDAFKIERPSSDIDIKGMVEDFPLFKDDDAIKRVGYFLFCCNSRDKRCFDPLVLADFARFLTPWSTDTTISDHYRCEKIDFLHKFTTKQIRLMLFIFMNANDDTVYDDEMKDFLIFWTNRYVELGVH